MTPKPSSRSSTPHILCPSRSVSRTVLGAAFSIAGFFLSALPSARAQGVTDSTYVGPDTGVWNVPANWNPALFPDAVGAIARFTSVQAATRNVPLGEDITIGSLFLRNDTSFANNIGANSGVPILTFDAAGAGPAILSVTGNPFGVGNPNSMRGPVVLQDNLLITVDPTTGSGPVGTLTFIGLGQTITGPGGIIKEGLGQMNFADTSKDFAGPLIVNAGRARFNANGRIGLTASVTINSGAQFNLDGGAVSGVPINFTFNSASTVLTLNGTGLGVGSPLGNFPGAIRKDGVRTAQLDNLITLQTDSAINVANASGGLTLTNTISGPGRLIMGALPGDVSIQPTLTLTANNSYTGGTTITSGTLVLSSAAADLGTGNVTVDGMTPGPTGSGSNGRLTIQTGVLNAISDFATLTLTGSDLFGTGNDIGGFATLEAGVNEVVGGLVLGGVAQGNGIYGSSTSGAVNANDEYFAGPGTVTVVPEAAGSAMLLAGIGAVVGLQRFRRRS